MFLALSLSPCSKASLGFRGGIKSLVSLCGVDMYLKARQRKIREATVDSSFA